MSDYTFEDYLVMIYREHNTSLRLGQQAFTTLGVMRPDLAEQVMGMELDPFYADEYLPEFLAYVGHHWNDSRSGGCDV